MVKARNSQGLESTESSSLTTYDCTFPDGRVDMAYKCTSHPHKLRANVIVFDDSELVPDRLSHGVGYSPSSHGHEVEVTEGASAERKPDGHFETYERLGKAYAATLRYENLRLHHGMKYYVNADINNVLGYRAVLTSEGTMVDYTPPEPGPLGHLWRDFLVVGGSNWDGFKDEECGIHGYTWAVGTTVCGTDVASFRDPHTSIPNPDDWTYTGLVKDLHLQDGRYYTTVQAVNDVLHGGDLVTTVCHSTPFVVDTSPPNMNSVEEFLFDESFRFLVVYYNATDDTSGIARMEFGLGKTKYDVMIRRYLPFEIRGQGANTYLVNEEFETEEGVPAWIRLKVVNNDGARLGLDICCQNSTTEICAQWVDFHDPESNIDSYFWGVGLTEGSDDIVPFTKLTSYDKQSCVHVQLQHNVTYFSTVVANNKALNTKSSNASSNGLPGNVSDGAMVTDDEDYTSETATVTTSWAGFYDPESGLAPYSLSVFINDELENTFSGIDIDKLQYTDHAFSLQHRDIVTAELQATNRAGSNVKVVSDGMLVDHTPPDLVYMATENKTRYQQRDDTLDLTWEFQDLDSGIAEYRCQILELFQGRKRDEDEDIDFSHDKASIALTFSGFSSDACGIVGYEWGIGTTPFATDVMPYTDFGLVVDDEGNGFAQAHIMQFERTDLLQHYGVVISPEPRLEVWDGPGDTDMDGQTDLGVMQGTWRYSDPCPVLSVEWSLTELGGKTVFEFSEIPGNGRQFYNDDLHLENLKTYVNHIRIKDALNRTFTAFSDGITMLLRSPDAKTVRDGLGANDQDFQEATDRLSANWDAFGDARSTLPSDQIVRYEAAVGTDRRYSTTRNDEHAFQDVGLQTEFTFYGLNLTAKTKTYYVTVRAHSAAGSFSESSSDGIKGCRGKRLFGAYNIYPLSLDGLLLEAANEKMNSSSESCDATDNANNSSASNATKFEDSELPAYYLDVRVVDHSGLMTDVKSVGLFVDSSPPLICFVRCFDPEYSPDEAVLFLGNNHTVGVQWDVSEDVSEIIEVSLRLGTQPLLGDISAPVYLKQAEKDYIFKHLSPLLQEDETYYVTLEVKNEAGMTSRAWSNFTVHTVPPDMSAVSVSLPNITVMSVGGVDVGILDNVEHLEIDLGVDPAAAADLDVDHYEWAIGSNPVKDDVFPRTVIGFADTKKVAIVNGFVQRADLPTDISIGDYTKENYSSSDQPDPTANKFLMEPGRCLQQKIYGVSKAHVSTALNTMAMCIKLNQPPVIHNTSFTMLEDGGQVEFNIRYRDDEGDRVVFTVARQPGHGIAKVTQDDKLLYIPDPNFSGRDIIYVIAQNDSVVTQELRIGPTAGNGVNMSVFVEGNATTLTSLGVIVFSDVDQNDTADFVNFMHVNTGARFIVSDVSPNDERLSSYNMAGASEIHAKDIQLNISEGYAGHVTYDARVKDTSGAYSMQVTLDTHVLISPCIHGDCEPRVQPGTCQDPQRAFTFDPYLCKCDVGYEGQWCETDTNDCATATCSPIHDCVDLVGGYRCDYNPSKLAAIIVCCTLAGGLLIVALYRFKKRQSKVDPWNPKDDLDFGKTLKPGKVDSFFSNPFFSYQPSENPAVAPARVGEAAAAPEQPTPPKSARETKKQDGKTKTPSTNKNKAGGSAATVAKSVPKSAKKRAGPDTHAPDATTGTAEPLPDNSADPTACASDDDIITEVNGADNVSPSRPLSASRPKVVVTSAVEEDHLPRIEN
nr:hypothetical protein BaRGS_031107 [Batillaria attramentaria]